MIFGNSLSFKGIFMNLPFLLFLTSQLYPIHKQFHICIPQLSCFVATLIKEFLSKILKFTKQKARSKLLAQTSDKEFTPITIEELERFIGLQIYLCYNILPIEKEHWSTNPLKGTLQVKDFMSRNKYRNVKYNLRFYNKDNFVDSDKVYKIRALINKISEVARYKYQPDKEVSKDESLVKFDGRFKHKVTIPRKAAVSGIESINICESKTATF